MIVPWRLKQGIRLLVPPIVLNAAKFIIRRCCREADRPATETVPTLEYAPAGWDTKLTGAPGEGWNSPRVVATEKAKWEAFCRNLEGTGPLGFSHESTDLSEIRNPCFHNIHISFGYVLALAAQGRESVSVLDVGGGLGLSLIHI